MDKLTNLAIKLRNAQSRIMTLEDALREQMVIACHGPGLQREMAKRLRISDQYVSDIVRGRRRVSDALIARILGAK